MNATLCYGPGGDYIEFYRDDDSNSGYGDNPRVAHWYGSPPELKAIIDSGRHPKGLRWVAPKWQPAPHAGEWF